MLDPLPIGYYGLDEAMPLLAADISDQEVSEEQRLKKPVKELNPAVLHWVKRELAIQKLYAALGGNDLIALVRDPQNGELFRLTGADWRCLLAGPHHRRHRSRVGGRGDCTSRGAARATAGDRIRSMAHKAGAVSSTASRGELCGVAESCDAGEPPAEAQAETCVAQGGHGKIRRVGAHVRRYLERNAQNHRSELGRARAAVQAAVLIKSPRQN